MMNALKRPDLGFEEIASLAPEGLARLITRASSRAWEPIAFTLSLQGTLPDRIRAAPRNLRAGSSARGSAILHGRWNLAGTGLDLEDIQPWVTGRAMPDPFKASLHSFSWLGDLGALAREEGEAAHEAREHARVLADGWIYRNMSFSEPAWRPEVAGRRVLSWLCELSLLLDSAELAWRTRFHQSVGLHARYLTHVMDLAPAGVPRLTTVIGALTACVAAGEDGLRIQRAVRVLGAELARQILPDGGHASRSPALQLELLADLLTLKDAYIQAGAPLPSEVQDSIKVMMPILRFFHEGHGALAAFHGAGAHDPETVLAILASEPETGTAIAHAAHSGFHRLLAGGTLVIIDAGAAPEIAMAEEAHAGCLAFELVSGAQRIVVNCGRPSDGAPQRQRLARTTAAHSTLSLGDSSSAQILSGPASKLLGPRLVRGPREVDTARHEDATEGGGLWLDLAHDGYAESYGRRHARRLYLKPGGGELRGEDRIEPLDRAENLPTIPFALRFHLHPSVTAELLNGEEGCAMLTLASGEVWHFQSRGGQLSLGGSIHYGPQGERPTRQLVMKGRAGPETVTLRWAFRHRSR